MSLFSICFETDITVVPSSNRDRDTNKIISGACGDDSIPNKDAFTQANILNLKTRIIPNTMIKDLQEHYNITFPHIKLWQFDINESLGESLGDNCEKLVCIILFINGVYGIHYISNIDTLNKQKQYILDTIISKYKLYNYKNENYTDNDKYVLLINTFNSDGSTNTSIYEPIMSF
jgi:hypothetical protein